MLFCFYVASFCPNTLFRRYEALVYSTKSLTRAAMIAAFYCVLTLLFQPFSYGPVQFRISEALTLLPVLLPEAVPGLTIGCLLANILGGAPWYDVVFGTLATLLAAICTRKLRDLPAVGAAMPVLFNAVIVGPVVYLAYSHAPGAAFSLPLLLKDVSTVAIGEAVICYVLGLMLVSTLGKTSFSGKKEVFPRPLSRKTR